MPAARIIPCLDVADGRVVKGVRFRDHRDVGDIVDHALRYRDEGADELVFYDITASADGRSLDLGWVERVARVIDIPFSVAGGIGDVATARAVLAAGADKVSINSPALERPELIAELAAAHSDGNASCSASTACAGDGRFWSSNSPGGPRPAATAAARRSPGRREAAALGAGEIVLNCMDRDGVRDGYDLAQLGALVAAVDVPVIISGGAGEPAHFAEAFRAGASGALAASVFHDRPDRDPRPQAIPGRRRASRCAR